MAELWRFLQYHPKPAFSKKVQRGHQDKFFKKRLKSSPRLKGPKALFHKWHYPLISMHLKGKDWKRFWGKKAAPKVPEWPSYGNFCKVTQNPHFLKKCKGGTKGNFSKSSRCLKGQEALLCKLNYTLIKIHLKCKHQRRFRRKPRLQKCLNRQVMAIIARSPKTRIF